MDNARFEAFFRSPIQSDQQGKRPRPRCSRHLNTQGQNDPFVPPAMHEMLMARPHGVTVTAFAIDMLAAMLTDRVVTRQFQNALCCETFRNRCGEPFRQRQTRPASMRKHTMIRTEVTR